MLGRTVNLNCISVRTVLCKKGGWIGFYGLIFEWIRIHSPVKLSCLSYVFYMQKMFYNRSLALICKLLALLALWVSLLFPVPSTFLLPWCIYECLNQPSKLPQLKAWLLKGFNLLVDAVFSLGLDVSLQWFLDLPSIVVNRSFFCSNLLCI